MTAKSSATDTEFVAVSTAIPDQAAAPGSGKVRAVVAAHVAALTRFEDSDLSEAEPEQHLELHATLALEQSANFQITTWKGSGALPANVDSMRSAAAMNGALQERLSAAWSEAPAALKDWARGDQRTYRRIMHTSHAFLQAPKAAGYDYTCATCSGSCQVTCSACYGRGKSDCFSCHGAGRTTCGFCHGSRNTTCHSCGGSGNTIKYVSESVWNSNTNSYDYVSGSVSAYCDACSGSGSKTCYNCDYAGKVSCSGCHGNGTINCGHCYASGKVDCVACAATGRLHEYGRVSATISLQQALAIEGAEPVLEALVRTKVDPARLPEYGELLQVQHSASVLTSVESIYRVRLDVLHALLETGGARFSIYALGPTPTVFDYQNIAGHLLEADLADFEAVVQAPLGLFGKRHGALLDATALFLRSELNMLIAEKTSGKKLTPDAAAAAVEKELDALVEPRYIERTALALQSALTRVYGAQLAEPAIYLCALAALCATAMAGFSWPYPHGLLNGAIIVGGGALAWLATEWRTRRKIGASFESALAARVLEQIKIGGSVRRWRYGTAAAGILAVVFASIGITQIPGVRAARQEKLELAQAPATLQHWLGQSEVDWQQRRYPARTLLEHDAVRSNPHAQIILAWQLLLGADGLKRDVAHAGRLLDQVAAPASHLEIWKTAKAVQALHQEITFDELRAASSTLKHSADRAQFAEARYWEARTYLDQRSPLHAPARGMAALKWAADKGHAHAALMLGQQLLQESGSKRHVRQARSYLEVAERAGLAAAREALAALKK